MGYEVILEDAAPHEIEFFERTLALLEGRIVFKRFGSSGSLKREIYNPLKKKDPKRAGFGDRQVRLNKDLTHIEVIRTNKSMTPDQSFPVGELFRVVVPQTTQDIIRVQKTAKSTTHGEALITSNSQPSGRFITKDTKLKKTNFVEKSCEVRHFPFEIVMKSGSFEIVSTSYEDYRDIIRGVECLIAQKKNLKKLAKRITVQETVPHSGSDED